MLTLREHRGPVRALAYSPDGRVLASGSEDRTVKLWNLATGQVRHGLAGHEAEVRALAFSPDARRLASGSWDGTLRLWKVRKLINNIGDRSLRDWLVEPRGRPLGENLGGGIWCVAFAPDGWALVTGCTDGTVLLWHLMGDEPRRFPLSGHKWPVSAACFSTNGKWLASAGHDRTVRLWDPHFGREQAVLTGHTDWVRTVAFSPDSRTLASAGDDCVVRLWDVAGRTERAVLAGHTKAVCHLVFSAEGHSLTTAGADETVRVWDVVTGRQRSVFDWGVGRVQCLALAPDGMTAAAGGSNNEIVVWDLDTVD